MKTILIIGATGQQGGATAQQLLQRGYNVKALTRDANSAAARNLALAGAEIIEGNMDDYTLLVQEMKGVDGVFSVQPGSWQPTPATDTLEADRGIAIAKAAQEAGVPHLIYTSVLGSEMMATFRPFFKFSIETFIREHSIPATILRPPGFMENVLLPNSGIAGGKLYDPTPAHLKVPYIATWDIGTFAVKAFDDPEAYIGQTLDLAGDQLTATEIAAKISDKLQKNITHVQVPITILMEQSPILGQLFGHLNAQGYPRVDIAALKAIHPKLLSFSEWLETTQVIPV